MEVTEIAWLGFLSKKYSWSALNYDFSDNPFLIRRTNLFKKN
jgi:hypothetical protein